MVAERVLITGADGYLGSRLARKLLAETDVPLLLWVRAGDTAALREKQARLATILGPAGTRVEVLGSDLAVLEPFEQIDPSSIRAIAHSAAVIRFNVERDLARDVNVEGARKILGFARRCPSLESVLIVSSVYASGLRTGPIEERRYDDSAGFANHYEWSKWATEELLHDFKGPFADLPWRIARVATVIADDESGAVTQQNSFHNTLKLLFFGLLSILPGDPKVTPYFVTGEFAAMALAELLLRSPPRATYHVAHKKAESGTLGDLLDIAFEVFQEDESFRSRRILKPLYCDAEAFDLLVEGVGSSGGAIVRQALQSVAPFARQLFRDKDVKNERLASALKAYRAPDPRLLIRNTCRQLVANRWRTVPRQFVTGSPQR